MQNLEAWVFDHKKIPQYNTFNHNKNSKENHKPIHQDLLMQVERDWEYILHEVVD